MSAPSPDDARRRATAPPSVVGAGTSVAGEVDGAGDLVVRGSVRGTVRLGGSLTVEPEGALLADVTAGGTVRLEAGSRTEGDIRAPRVVIVDGASFRGSVDTTGGSALPVPPPVPDVPPAGDGA